MTTVRYIYMISFDRSETNSVCDNQNTWDDTISCSILVPTDVPPPSFTFNCPTLYFFALYPTVSHFWLYSEKPDCFPCQLQ